MKNVNSGFLKPVLLSKEMSDFIGTKQNELKSRVDVTKFLCKYIKDNQLQDEKDRRCILPNKALKALLNYKDTEKPLTYYRIQTYIKHHFIKSESVV